MKALFLDKLRKKAKTQLYKTANGEQAKVFTSLDLECSAAQPF